MSGFENNHGLKDSLLLGERLQLAEAAGGIGSFEFDPVSWQWSWTPQVTSLFGSRPARSATDFRGIGANGLRG